MSVINNLDTLYECREKLGDLIAEMDKALNDALPPEVRVTLNTIRAEYEPQLTYLEQQIRKLESEIKESTLLLGESIRGKNLMAVFNKGRVSWDTNKLEGFAEAYPEIKAFRKVGEPSITIKRINSKEGKDE